MRRLLVVETEALAATLDIMADRVNAGKRRGRRGNYR